MLAKFFERFRKAPPFFAAAEFWIYLPTEAEPDQSALISALLNQNPYGHLAFTKTEGLLFSDIRTHLGLVTKAKNPHAFRPDLFETGVEPTKEILRNLADAKAFMRVRYVSETPLIDRRHLQFLTMVADAIARQQQSQVVYDVLAEHLMSSGELRERLTKDRDATKFDGQVSVRWVPEDDGGSVQTKGLVKVGVPELVSYPVNLDQRVLATEVIELAARELWESASLPQDMKVEAYDDEFALVFEPPKDRKTKVRLLRRQAT